ncbi:MAG: Fur family transcriptional regulator [Planctomycetaceae bacterium]|nr:Fur family transcriptional regulator [Planctomycetaceae bacterium]
MLLRESGLRATAARVSILQHLAKQRRPVSHAEVVDALGPLGFDQSTIFRGLQELADASILTRLELGDQIRRFELRKTAGTDALEHPHFMCVDCGAVACLDGFSVTISPSRGRRRQKLGEITEVLLRGHCGECLANRAQG